MPAPAPTRTSPHRSACHAAPGPRWRWNIPVPQLADMEVAQLPVQPGRDPLPAQEDIAGCLHQPLARHDPLTLVAVLAGAGEGGQDRLACVLDLQEQRIGLVAADHQDGARQPWRLAAGQCDNAMHPHCCPLRPHVVSQTPWRVTWRHPDRVHGLAAREECQQPGGIYSGGPRRQVTAAPVLRCECRGRLRGPPHHPRTTRSGLKGATCCLSQQAE